MKKNIYTLILTLLSVFSIQAASVFYVNPKSAAASDNNDGSQATPWATIEGSAEKWKDTECSINIAAGEYFFTSRISLGANVSLIGSNKDEVFFMGLNDADFEVDREGNEPYTPSGFFNVNGGLTFEVSNITIKNIRLGTPNAPAIVWGGAIVTQNSSILKMKDVNFIKCIIPMGGGAGIDCKGAMELTNVRFDACSADRQGTAISLSGDSKMKLEGCQFINNKGIASGASVIQVYPNTVASELLLNNCYFEGSTYLGYGAAIQIGNFTGGKLKFHTTNSTFANNQGEYGGCIFISTSTDPRDIDMLVCNSSFLKNTLTTGPHGVIYAMNGGPSSTITGNISFVNNSMYNNQRTSGFSGGASGFYFQDMSVKFNYINNISLSRNEDIVFFSSNVTAEHCTPIIKGNIYENIGGGNNALVLLLQDASINKKVGQQFSAATETELEKPYIEGNLAVKMETTLTANAKNKAPYLKIAETSVAIDAGIIDGVWVPALDIRGQAIINEKKDAGVFEYSKSTNVTPSLIKESLSAYPNPFCNCITLNKEVAKVEIFTATGNCVIYVTNTNQIDTSALSKGFYLLRTTDNNGCISVIKMQK